MELMDYLQKMQKEMDELTEALHSLAGTENPNKKVSQPDEKSLEGLSEDERNFLTIEKKYGSHIAKRATEMESAKDRIDWLQRLYDSHESARSKATSHDEIVRIAEKMRTIKEDLDKAQCRFDEIEGGEPQKDFYRLMTDKIEGKTNDGINAKKI